MGFFRRDDDETLNERLLREAGLDDDQGESEGEPEPVPDEEDETEQEAPAEPEPFDPYAGTYPSDQWLGALSRAMARPARYDSVTTVDAPGLAGDRIEFATLPDGEVIVDEQEGDADLAPLADVVEKQLKPPYRVVARRQEGDLWTLAAREIDVMEFSFAGGDGIELVSNDGEQEVKVDGEPWQGEIPALAAAGEAFGHDYVVQADRLDGDLWEIQASAL